MSSSGHELGAGLEGNELPIVPIDQEIVAEFFSWRGDPMIAERYRDETTRHAVEVINGLPWAALDLIVGHTLKMSAELDTGGPNASELAESSME